MSRRAGGPANLVEARLSILHGAQLFQRFYAARGLVGFVDTAKLIPTIFEAIGYETEFGSRSSVAYGQMTSDARDVMRRLVETQDRGLIPPLLEALGDRNQQLRAYAASALGGFKPPATEAIPQLRKLLRDYEEDIRHNAAMALGMMWAEGAEAAVDAGRLATSDAEERVRRAAIGALSSMASYHLNQTRNVPDDKMQAIADQAIPALVLALEKDASADVREAAADALGEVGPRAGAAVAALAAVIDKGSVESEKVRGEACMTLAQIGEPAAAAWGSLSRAALDPSERVRQNATTALSRLEKFKPANADALTAAALADAGPAVGAAPTGTLFEDARMLPKAFADKIGGPPKVYSLLIYENMAYLTASVGGEVKKYHYDKGYVAFPESDSASCDDTFSLDVANFADIPMLIEDGAKRVGAGAHALVFVRLDGGIFCKKPHWQLYFENAGQVTFKTNGKFIEIIK